jgi:outer membrane lipoprotein-sorting protein
MTSARFMAWVGVLLFTAVPTVAAAQNVPLPQSAPKKGNQAARPQTATDAGRPMPVHPPVESAAYDGSQYPVVQKINNYLMSLQTLIGDFVQIGPDGTRSAGKFYIQKPGRVRFEYHPPSPIDIIADGSSVIVRDRDLNTEDPYPLSQTPLRYLLADRVDLARDANLVAISQDNAFISLTLEERQLLVGTHRMVLMFNAKDLKLRQWTITDPQGYQTTVAVYNLDTTHKPDPGVFAITYKTRQ